MKKKKQRFIGFLIVFFIIFLLLLLMIVSLHKKPALVGCTFTKTYYVGDMIESNEPNAMYLVLRQDQDRRTSVVKVAKNVVRNVIPGFYYEFTFQTMDESIEEEIASIFTFGKLMDVEEAFGDVDNQVQDAVCHE